MGLKTRGRRPVQDERAGMRRIRGRDPPTRAHARPQLVLGIVSNAGTAWCRESPRSGRRVSSATRRPPHAE